MPDILVRHVPAAVVEGLKKRATAQGRSLQRELLMILSEAAMANDSSPEKIADRVRRKLAASGRRFADSVPLIREDRDR